MLFFFSPDLTTLTLIHLTCSITRLPQQSSVSHSTQSQNLLFEFLPIGFELCTHVHQILSIKLSYLLNHLINRVMKEKSKQKQMQKGFTLLNTCECLKLDKNKVNFCKYPIFASSFKQLTIVAELMDYFSENLKKEFHLLKIKTKVHPFQNSQRYKLEKIFTVKAVQNGQQVHEMELPIRYGEPITILIRANIPQLQISTDISGTLELQVDQLNPLILQIHSRGEVPQIVCLKELEDKRSGAKIIKIPSKQSMKIPFKNCSNINFSFEVKIIGKQLDKPDADGVKISVLANEMVPQEKSKQKEASLRVDANSAFFVHLSLEMLKKDNSIRVARRILVLQVQGTKLLFPFPLQIIITL